MRVELRCRAQTRVSELRLPTLERFTETAEQHCMGVLEALGNYQFVPALLLSGGTQTSRDYRASLV